MGCVSRPVLQLWFEFASTYSYPAVQRIEALAAGLGVGVEWKPFLLGPVFKSQGWNDSPFNLYPAKGRYMWRDLERLCAKYGLPFRRPSVFPRPSLLAARVACTAAAEPWCGDFVRAVFHANFAHDRDIASVETVTAIRRPGRALVEVAAVEPGLDGNPAPGGGAARIRAHRGGGEWARARGHGARRRHQDQLGAAGEDVVVVVAGVRREAVGHAHAGARDVRVGEAHHV